MEDESEIASFVATEESGNILKEKPGWTYLTHDAGKLPEEAASGAR